MGRAPRFMAKESLFTRAGARLGAARAPAWFPSRGRRRAAAAQQTARRPSETLVEHGRGVIVYPEGTLTRDPDLWPMRGKTGAVRLALAGGIPLIPMAHWGAQDIMPRYGKLSLWPLRKPVQVDRRRPGRPLRRSAASRRPAALPSARRPTALMNAITGLLVELRGEKAPAERWNPAEHGQRETGRLEP